jgi:hypothetical protein
LVFPWRVGTKQSGEIAAVDFRQFGKRAGEIIADATRLPHRKPH